MADFMSLSEPLPAPIAGRSRSPPTSVRCQRHGYRALGVMTLTIDLNSSRAPAVVSDA